MMRTLSGLIGYEAMAKDGAIGPVKDFYLDDFYWIVRYMVPNVGSRGSGKITLLSTALIGQPDDETKTIPVDITLEAVAKSPVIDQDMPISRQFELTLHQFYQLPFYWMQGSMADYPLAELAEEMRESRTPREEEIQEARLQSVDRVTGLRLRARDGDIGHIQDFIVDDEAWKILYMVVDTGGFLSGQKVLVSLNWVEKFDWDDRVVDINLSKETIQNSPPYDEALPLNREYETSLYNYYGKKKYWER